MQLHYRDSRAISVAQLIMRRKGNDYIASLNKVLGLNVIILAIYYFCMSVGLLLFKGVVQDNIY